MDNIINDGKTVICPECFVHIHLEKPVIVGQIIRCQACRVRIQIVEEDGRLDAIVMPDKDREEDKSW